MKWHLAIAILSALGMAGTFSTAAPHLFSQTSFTTDPAQPLVFVNKLSPAVFPPLARVARILGDVKIQLKIRQDGSVESAEVVSGHPMLQEAALDSARKSTYQCTGCSTASTTYLVTYTYGFRDDGPDCSVKRARSPKCFGLWHCGQRQSAPTRPPVVGQSPGHVMVLADSMCVETQNAR